MNADTMNRIFFISFIALSLIVASFFLTACSNSGKFSKQDCSNFPLLVTDCMAKEVCGVRGGDNTNYESCKLECEDKIHKQCLVQKVAPKK